jgi:hypothetical protein
MTTGSKTPQTVVAEVAALAASHGWTNIAEFVAAIPGPNDPDVTILAAQGTDSGPLAAWIEEQGGAGTPVSAHASVLEALAAEPARALLPNRVLVALSCGRLLTADTAAAAAAVLARPAATYRVLLTGAEGIRGSGELAAIERAVWRVLLAPDGAQWRGQDIAARGCLLWTDAATQGELRDRIAGDVAALRGWLAGPVAVLPDLERQRASTAVALALDALRTQAAAAADGPRDAAADLDTRQLADLAVEVRGLHARLLNRLDSDASTTERQVLALLDGLRQDLITAAASERGLDRDQPARRVREWLTQADQVVGQQSVRTQADARHLLELADWDRMNQVVPSPGGCRYPDVILDELGPQVSSLPPGTVPAGGVQPRAGRARESVLDTLDMRTVAIAVVGVALAERIGLPRVPIVAAAAATVLGGSVQRSRRRADEAQRQAEQAARASVGEWTANAGSAVLEALRGQASARRTAVDLRFTTLERALDERAERAERARQAAKATSAADTDEGTRLAALLGELAEPQATPASPDKSPDK